MVEKGRESVPSVSEAEWDSGDGVSGGDHVEPGERRHPQPGEKILDLSLDIRFQVSPYRAQHALQARDGHGRPGDELVRARTVVWAAGVRASPLLERLGVPLYPDGRVLVAPDLTLPGRPEVFVIGPLIHWGVAPACPTAA